jgi:phosphatidylserine/phosphatidylglycerophosphate/cardiolipin synthase-like enzyme
MSQYEIVVPVALQHTQEVTCTPPWYVQDTEYPPAMATYEPLINGEEAFRAVHEAIVNAKTSVDIICWGFQPSMYFIRDGISPCIGELLLAKAREGVKVRILGWEMPYNTAGKAGEANLPGKGPFRYYDRELQPSTDDQYAYDRYWFANYATADNMAAALQAARGTPVFVSRGFSLFERAEVAYQAMYKSHDPQISASTQFILTATATHHQKTVLVDYELADRAVGFVMGHNMLDEYWDTDAHTALKRGKDGKPAPNRGPRGDTPRQDISSRVSGPILEHLHHNFASAWRKETGEDLLAPRQAMQVGPQLQCVPQASRQIAQILRTQAQEGIRDIEQLYLQAANNATQFIYIENQYFRWPPLAELIKAVAAGQTKAGRDPAIHGNLHLFVVTNASDGGIGSGTVNTQRMLESLGRGETMPKITRLRRIEQAKTEAAVQELSLSERLEAHALVMLTNLTDALGATDLSDRAREDQRRKAWANDWRQRSLNNQIAEIEKEVLATREFPGLKVHVCSLVAPDSPAGKKWMDVYIHSKLMIVDDVFTTHGSANINTRSMQVDSELNIAHEWASVTQALRRRLWEMHTNGMGAQDDPEKAFEAWEDIIKRNKDLQLKQMTPYAPLVEFYYGESKLSDLD